MKNKIKTIQLNIFTVFILCVIFALFTEVVSLVIQPGSIADLKSAFLNQPVLLLLNFLPICFTLLILTVLSNSFFISAAVNWLFWTLLSYGNYLKIQYRSDPLIFSDLAQIREAITAVSDFSLTLNYSLIIFITAIAVLLFVAGFFIRNRKRNIKLFFITIAVILGLTVISDTLLYNTDFFAARNIYYNKLEKTDDANHALTSEELGFVYYFTYSHNRFSFKKPEEYSKQEAEKELSAYSTEKAKATDESPHVIMVMLEAFSDISNESVFNFDTENNPLQNFNSIADSGEAISGHLIVPNNSAGTANSEFDVMTGVSTKLITDDGIPFFNIRKNTPSIASVFTEAGYLSIFTHPGYDWYYNRNNVYKYFGFDELYFVDDYQNPSCIGSLVSDVSVGDMIIDNFEESVRQEEKLFEFAVTIQNHMPYTAGRYGDNTDYQNKNLPVSVDISAEAEEQLNIYFEGVKSEDNLIKQLTDYFSESEEPVVLVFFGDHIPALGSEYSVYRELGLTQGLTDTNQNIISTYETPYLIWANAAAESSRAYIEKEATANSNDLSAVYLGAKLLDCIGFGSNDAYFSFLLEQSKILPGFWEDIALTYTDDTHSETKISSFDEIDEKYLSVQEKIKKLGYYRIK